jgi:hypothetical protein
LGPGPRAGKTRGHGRKAERVGRWQTFLERRRKRSHEGVARSCGIDDAIKREGAHLLP